MEYMAKEFAAVTTVGLEYSSVLNCLLALPMMILNAILISKFKDKIILQLHQTTKSSLKYANYCQSVCNFCIITGAAT